jgi:hypothetical protein
MNLARYILGIALAFILYVALVIFFVECTDSFLLRNLNYKIYLVIHSLQIISNGSLFVFLSCLFVPSPKKYAAVITLVSFFVIAILGLYVQYTEYRMQITAMLICSYASLFLGGGIGLIFSYYRFRNKGWYPSVKKTKIDESY